jgi:hypothetical protein
MRRNPKAVHAAAVAALVMFGGCSSPDGGPRGDGWAEPAGACAESLVAVQELLDATEGSVLTNELRREVRDALEGPYEVCTAGEYRHFADNSLARWADSLRR